MAFLLPQLPALVAGGSEPAGIQTLIARALALVLLLAATGLSVVKPWGKTPRGRAGQPAGRQPERQPRKQSALGPGSDPVPVQKSGKLPARAPVKQARVPVQQK